MEDTIIMADIIIMEDTTIMIITIIITVVDGAGVEAAHGAADFSQEVLREVC
jgi:hypothetical protein